MLAEFDEGKRSCRKRLAGHNERRRKPQFNTYLGKVAISLHLLLTSQKLADCLFLQVPHTSQQMHRSPCFSREFFPMVSLVCNATSRLTTAGTLWWKRSH